MKHRLKPGMILEWAMAPNSYYRVVSGPDNNEKYVVEFIDTSSTNCGRIYESECDYGTRVILDRAKIDWIIAEYTAWRLTR